MGQNSSADWVSTSSSIMTIIINFLKCLLACFCYQTLYNCSETANTILCLNIFILYTLMCDPPRCSSFPWKGGKMDIINYKGKMDTIGQSIATDIKMLD